MFGKILFITSRYGALPEGMVNSLKRMGVDYVETPIWNLQEFYDTFHPQVVIFFHHFLKEWDERNIEDINKLSCHKIYWCWETPWEIDYLVKFHHFFTHILVQDKSSAKFLEESIGKKVTFVPHAADIALAEKREVPFEYRSDLCFIGAAYPSRLKFFREVLPYLKDYKVVIGGTGWEFLPDTQGQKIINTGLSAEEYIKWTMGAKIVLNLHRLSDELTMSNNSYVKASSPNNRFFEVNMMGKFQMVDYVRQPELNEYCDNISFKGSAEFLEKFYVWISDDSGRKDFADKVQKETLERHSYENRFTELIAKII